MTPNSGCPTKEFTFFKTQYLRSLIHFVYASATKHLGIDMLVGLSVSTQISKKFGDIGWETVQIVKQGKCQGCSRDNCTVHTQLPPILSSRRLLVLFLIRTTQIAWNGSWIRSKDLSTKTSPNEAYSCLQVCVFPQPNPNYPDVFSLLFGMGGGATITPI